MKAMAFSLVISLCFTIKQQWHFRTKPLCLMVPNYSESVLFSLSMFLTHCLGIIGLYPWVVLECQFTNAFWWVYGNSENAHLSACYTPFFYIFHQLHLQETPIQLGWAPQAVTPTLIGDRFIAGLNATNNCSAVLVRNCSPSRMSTA